MHKKDVVVCAFLERCRRKFSKFPSPYHDFAPMYELLSDLDLIRQNIIIIIFAFQTLLERAEKILVPCRIRITLLGCNQHARALAAADAQEPADAPMSGVRDYKQIQIHTHVALSSLCVRRSISCWRGWAPVGLQYAPPPRSLAWWRPRCGSLRRA